METISNNGDVFEDAEESPMEKDEDDGDKTKENNKDLAEVVSDDDMFEDAEEEHIEETTNSEKNESTEKLINDAFFAARNFDLSKMELLLMDKGNIDIVSLGGEPLLIFLLTNNPGGDQGKYYYREKMIDLILKKGAQVNYLFEGLSPLHIAIDNCDYLGGDRIFEEIVNSGANVAIRIKDSKEVEYEGMTPFNYLFRKFTNFNFFNAPPSKIANLLLEKDPNLLNEASDSGDTPLHSAVKTGISAGVEFLIKKRALTSKVNDQGKAPLDIVQGNIDFNDEAEKRKMREILERNGESVSMGVEGTSSGGIITGGVMTGGIMRSPR